MVHGQAINLLRLAYWGFDREFIESLDFFQDELDADEERVSLISKQGLLEELKKYASENSMELSIEVWPEGMDWDDAEDSGDIELFNFN